MLPPPVIQMIRYTLAQRNDSIAADDNIGNSLTSSDETSMPKSKPANTPATENLAAIENTLAWFEDFNRAADLLVDERNASTQTHLVEFGQTQQLHVDDAPSSLNAQLPHTNIVTGEKDYPNHAVDVQSATTSILVNPKVSLLPPRRRGYFMAVSLPDPAAEFSVAVAPLLSCVWRHRGEVELIERGLLLASFGCYESDEDAPNRVLECGLAIVDQRGCAGLRMQCSIAIDCGWFETSTLSCTLPDGRLMRRQVVSSVARDVAVRMLPLGEVLNERLLITGDALRCVSAASLQGRVPVMLDHLKFDSLISRRRFIVVFAIPPATSTSGAAGRLFAHIIAAGLDLMINAHYLEAEAYFVESMRDEFLMSTFDIHSSRFLHRMATIATGFANVVRQSPSADVGPYFRGELTVFETFTSEFGLDDSRWAS
ncbi:Hypothetical protein, putative [Bodo saltans]|uniref:Uncharacterized protein n=1 Tax=Bodo saltans TaxID=75058 RepID=A0A0S4IZ74_BODSA|nr:Hypothetical protein, putative [Bodo saltans]|eukprot:CUG27274.1 Hypothetical protein, putative [Bodo saltans]